MKFLASLCLVLCILLSSCFFLHKPKALLKPTIPPESAVVTDKRMDELSGLIVSRRQPGILYVHNDSGDSSRFFAIGTDASLKEIFYFKGEKSLAPLGVKDNRAKRRLRTRQSEGRSFGEVLRHCDGAWSG